MSISAADRVLETSTTTGTGTYDLAGTSTGFQTFVAAFGSGNTGYYVAEDGTDWEVGLGTVTSGSPDTLARTTIYASTNGGSAVNWGAGTKNVFSGLPAEVLGSLLDPANTTGFMAHTAANAYAARTMTGTAGEITVTNGDGVAGAPTFSLAFTLTAAGKAILDDADADAQRATLVAQKDVITTRGDSVRGDATGAAERLALGASGEYKRSDGTDEAWSAIVAADLPAATDSAQGALETATAAEMVTGTATDKIVTPGRLENHLLVPACVFTFTGVATPVVTFIGGVLGAPTVAQTSSGVYTVTLAANMAATTYAVLVSIEDNAARQLSHDSKAVGSFVIRSANASDVVIDGDSYSVTVWGAVA